MRLLMGASKIPHRMRINRMTVQFQIADCFLNFVFKFGLAAS